MVGMPGTGLSGLFYVLLVIWMLVREALRLALGARPGREWLKIAKLSFLSAGIVGSLWAEAWLLTELFTPMMQLPASSNANVAISAVAPALTYAPFLVLAVLMLAVHAARILLSGDQAGAQKFAEPREELVVTESPSLAERKAA